MKCYLLFGLLYAIHRTDFLAMRAIILVFTFIAGVGIDYINIALAD